MQTEIQRLQQSADFWRERANKFELVLREIEGMLPSSYAFDYEWLFNDMRTALRQILNESKGE